MTNTIEFEYVTVFHDPPAQMLVDNLGRSELILERPDGEAQPVNLLPGKRLRVSNTKRHPLQVRCLDGHPGRVRVEEI